MQNIKKAITALAAAAVLAPTLVACSGSNDKIVSWTNDFGGEMLVNCDKETVKVLGDDAPDKFLTPEKLAAEVVKQASRENNPYGVLGAAMAQGMAEGAIEGACSSKIEDRLTEPDENGIRSILPKEATVVARGETGHYQDGIYVSIKDGTSYTWVKAGNMFADRVAAGDGYRLVVVDLTVGNDGKAPASLSGRSFQLQDAEGRRYDAIGFDSDLMLWVSETRGDNLSEWESVNPGARRTYTMVFRVPADVVSNVVLADRNEFAFQF